jgi:hypothetical protein
LQTKAKVKTIGDAGNFAAAIGKNIKKAYQDSGPILKTKEAPPLRSGWKNRFRRAATHESN